MTFLSTSISFSSSELTGMTGAVITSAFLSLAHRAGHTHVPRPCVGIVEKSFSFVMEILLLLLLNLRTLWEIRQLRTFFRDDDGIRSSGAIGVAEHDRREQIRRSRLRGRVLRPFDLVHESSGLRLLAG